MSFLSSKTIIKQLVKTYQLYKYQLDINQRTYLNVDSLKALNVMMCVLHSTAGVSQLFT